MDEKELDSGCMTVPTTTYKCSVSELLIPRKQLDTRHCSTTQEEIKYTNRIFHIRVRPVGEKEFGNA